MEKKHTLFANVLEAADQLSLDDQEILVDVIQRRIVDSRRADLAQDIRAAQKEFAEGHCQPITVDEIMNERMS